MLEVVRVATRTIRTLAVKIFLLMFMRMASFSFLDIRRTYRNYVNFPCQHTEITKEKC